MKKYSSNLLAIALIFFVSLGLIGCTPSAQQESDKETLTLPFNEDPVGELNPHMYLPSQFVTQDMVYEGLVSYGKDGEIQPSISEKWDLSPDGKTYTFTIRKGVKFSDGSDCNAYNVERNFQSIFSEKAIGQHTWFALTNYIASYKALDEYTFQLNLKEPYAATLYDLSMIRPIRMLGDAGFPEDGDTSKGIKAPIGTGPWVLKEHRENEYATFVQNQYYWGEKPKFQELTIKTIPDGETAALEFEAGNLDLIYGNGLISLDRFASFTQQEEYGTKVSDPTSTRLLILNSSREALQDVELRRALNHAVDKEKISKYLFEGVEQPADTLFSKNVPHTQVTLQAYDYHLEKAETILEEAGWKKGADGIRSKNGKKLVLSFPFIASKSIDKSVAEYIQGEWKKLGIEVEVHAMEEKAYWDEAAKGNYDLLQSFSWGAPWDPHAFFQSMTVANDNGGPDYVAQLGLPMKKVLDQKIQNALLETDENKMHEDYDYILKTLHDQAVYIPITYQSMTSVYRKDRISDVKFMPEPNRLPVFAQSIVTRDE